MDGTGQVQSWTDNPGSLGPLYPFVGWEVAIALACVAAWVLWTIWQARFENATYEREKQELQRAGSLTRAVLSATPDEEARKQDRNVAL